MHEKDNFCDKSNKKGLQANKKEKYTNKKKWSFRQPLVTKESLPDGYRTYYRSGKTNTGSEQPKKSKRFLGKLN